MSALGNDSDIQQWKKRCLQLEQQHDTIQSDGELLCKLLQRLTAVAEGVDQELDQQLAVLQPTVKSFPPANGFASKAQTVDGAVLQVLQRRDDGMRFSQESLSQLLRQLADMVDDPQIQNRKRELQDDIDQSVETYHQYPRLLNELTRFQARVLDLIPAAAQEAIAGEESEASELGIGDARRLCRHVGQLLLKMLEQLSIPKNLLSKARDLRTRVESEFGWDDIEQLLQEAVELAVKATANDHQEFENYLQSLNVQLDDIQSFLTESRQDQLDARESSRQLDESVRDDVAKMEDSLTHSTNLDQLKSSVRGQLLTIVRAVDTFRKEQESRESAAEKRLEHLQEQVELMEQKATEVQGHLEEQRLRAMSDPLTGLPNRAAFDDCVQHEGQRAQKEHLPLSLVVCDLDHFKHVNDNYGHLAGDKVLRLVSKILRGGLRSSDFICRYGGEEFVMVLPETNAEQAFQVMEKLRRVMEQSPFNFKGEPVRVTMSFGIAQARDDEAADELFARADKSLYQAKEQGRNRCVIAQ